MQGTITGSISRLVVEPEIERITTGRNQLLYCYFQPLSDPTVLCTVRGYSAWKDRVSTKVLQTASVPEEF
ncbi:hypothetical protein CHS0354_031302 [Potamilus streckersoni]|uniref:Uncharacterized protein n=1 Tax=Potamilus streckersoni TaxID=2493646 RepID=A0AAE0WAU8_9BIVA|nr:hypothetical protein CHS0354_031302 [Potamilus streckersoni]